MTVAVAKAIMQSRKERLRNDSRGFRWFLVDNMQDFGRRYPYPMGSYGSNFSRWLRSNAPEPYGSFGNGSAMRVSPCGIAAYDIEEAILLARLSAVVSHDHPEGIKGAEAVAVAVFMAKSGRKKEEIKDYIAENYYNLDFTLDEIRPAYNFDPSCQGTVPQAIVAFLESDSFEDALRNAVSIGGDSDTIGAITGSIAWTYYAVQTGKPDGYSGWVYNRFDESMLEIKKQACEYLPAELIDIADEFHDFSWGRNGVIFRTGIAQPIASGKDYETFLKDW